MFSKSCKYGLRAVLYLAQHSDGENKIGAKDLSARLDVPHYFLAKILQDLSRKKLISSTKGPNGGFYLTNENKEEPLLSIIDALEGRGWFEDCAFGLEQCNAKHPCPIHDLFQPLRTKLHEDLSTQTIRQFADKLDAGQIFIGLPELP